MTSDSRGPGGGPDPKMGCSATQDKNDLNYTITYLMAIVTASSSIEDCVRV